MLLLGLLLGLWCDHSYPGKWWLEQGGHWLMFSGSPGSGRTGSSDERSLRRLNLQWWCVLGGSHAAFSNNASSLSSNKVTLGGEFLNIANAPDRTVWSSLRRTGSPPSTCGTHEAPDAFGREDVLTGPMSCSLNTGTSTKNLCIILFHLSGQQAHWVIG